jgi:hypothetical protein
VTHKQDQLTKPAVQTISTSSDAVTANPQRTSSSGDMKIYISDEYWAKDTGHAQQELMAALVKTLTKAGLELRPDGRANVREAFKAMKEAKVSNRSMLNSVEVWIATPSKRSLITYPPQAAAA